MTEAEWLACSDPTPMLNFLQGKGSERKLRLFCCARCRNVWPNIKAEGSRRAVQVAEHYADNLVSKAELFEAIEEVNEVFEECMARVGREAARFADLAYLAVDPTSYEFIADILLQDRANEADNNPALCHMLHCIFGDLFHPITVPQPTTLVCQGCGGRGWTRQPNQYLPDTCPQCGGRRHLLRATGWVRQNDACVLKIAQGIYEDRTFYLLPILADALLDAGCDDEELIAHCRSEGPHVRGCWAVDAILGKS
jgi:hypothetical protein